MTPGEYIFYSAFFFLFFGVPTALAWASYGNRFRNFDVSVLWTDHETKSVDTLLVVFIGSWWVHSCAVILWTLKGSVTTADFTSYMAWGLPIVAAVIARRRTPKVPPDGSEQAKT